MLDRNLIGFLFAKSKFRTRGSHRWVLSIFVVVFCMVELCRCVCQDDGDCNRGVCAVDTGMCVCDDGWTGSECNHCSGRTRMDSDVGTIYDSEGQYNTDISCVWLIDSGTSGTKISLYLEDFATECSWDYLYIFDGDSIFAPLVAAFSGPIRYSDIHIVHEVTTTSGYAFLYFYSDAAFKFEGFNITYRMDACPVDCSGRGVCDPIYKNCTCDSGWTGYACSEPACPANCSGNGECSQTLGACLCDPGYTGSDCAVTSDEGYWTINDLSSMTGRASSSVVQQGSTVWIVGGYQFADADSNISIARHDLDLGTFEEVEQLGAVPVARYGHSAVLYEDEIYVFGGSLSGTKVTKDLMTFNVTSSSWDVDVLYDGDPIAVEGHTAVVYMDTIVVIFGYSPQFSYLSEVQEFDLVNRSWSIAETTGVQVRGSYGQSSALDQSAMVVYVHAGFSMFSKGQFLTDDLYQYDLAKKEWRVLSSSGQPRFLHSAVIQNDIMYVFGGNTHTDASQYTGAKCYSNDFLAYDLRCHSWSSIPINSTTLSQNIARYGHVSWTSGDSIVIYSGFTGVMQENLLVYHTGNCSSRDDSTLCLETTPGLPCHWDVPRNQCLVSGEADAVAPSDLLRAQCPSVPEYECNADLMCPNCLLTPGCGWYNDSCDSNSSRDANNSSDFNSSSLDGEVAFCPDVSCELYINCRSCNLQKTCLWFINQCINGSGGEPSSCSSTCDDLTSCASCLVDSNCMWCTNQERCIDSNSYISSYPYGLCWEWNTHTTECPVANCSFHKTCDVCQSDPQCGWCDSGQRNGLGTCLEGSLAGSLNADQDGNMYLDDTLCSADSWYYLDCPSCQCNGHSRCINESSSICQNCQNNTAGKQCEMCGDGYYGDALNGGSCAPCPCNDHETKCDNAVGSCYCDTKGITGINCDRCDINEKYFGNPLTGTCYYKLSMNYEYTFNLSSENEMYITKINLMTSPEVANRDIEFILKVKKEISMTLTYTTNSMPGVEIPISYQTDTLSFSSTFPNSDYNFNADANTTFYVYISNFTTPLVFKATFTQSPGKISLILTILMVFIITLVILLSALGLFWRLYQMYSTRSMIQHRAVELAVMARRPFTTMNLVIENTVPPDIVAGTNKKHPVAFASEVCTDGKAQVNTLFMQLPMPDGNTVLFGQTRFTLASALVQVKAKKGDRRNSQHKQENHDQTTREDAKPVGETTATTGTTDPPLHTDDMELDDRREPVENQSQPEPQRSPEQCVARQQSFPTAYDNAAMV